MNQTIYIYITLINPYKPIYPHIWNTTNNIPMNYITCPITCRWALALARWRWEAKPWRSTTWNAAWVCRDVAWGPIAMCLVFFCFFGGGLLFGRWFWRYLEQWMLKQHAETTWKTWQEHMICGRKAENKTGDSSSRWFFSVQFLHCSCLIIYNYCNLVYASIAAHVFSSNGAATCSFRISM